MLIRQTWVTYTELIQANDSVTSHYALVLTSAINVESIIMSPGLGLGPWANVGDAGMALLVIALPLDSNLPPTLPNPVRPDMSSEDVKPKTEMAIDSMHILASYGLTPQFCASLSGRPAIAYPGKEGQHELLHQYIEHEFTNQGVLPYNDKVLPECVIIKNDKMARAVRSSFLSNTVNRRTQYFAIGPSLHLAPSQWTLTEIWKTGGLVTFSPTFILRNPEKFGEIMGNIRMAPNWAAYVIPEVVQWVDNSWKTPT